MSIRGAVMMGTVEVLFKAWPVILFIGGLLIAVGIHQQKFKTVSRIVEIIEAEQADFMTEKNHKKDCELANLKVKQEFIETLSRLKDEIFPEIRSIKDDTLIAVENVRKETLIAVNDVKKETIKAIRDEFRER